MIIHTQEDIFEYLKFEKEIRWNIRKHTGRIQSHIPNFQENASESLACHIIKGGIILPQLSPITSIKRCGRGGKSKSGEPKSDVLVNDFHKIEVKATTSSEGTVTTSESNYDAFAWLWFDFRPYFNSQSNIIPIHVVTNPKQCITTKKYVEKLKQTKVNLKSAIGDAKKTGNYEYAEINLKTLAVMEDISKRFWI